MIAYSFCESAAAGPQSRWHIRKLSEKGKKSGGGIDTPFLCARKYLNGWDLEVEITEHHLGHACPGCVEVYRRRDE